MRNLLYILLSAIILFSCRNNGSEDLRSRFVSDSLELSEARGSDMALYGVYADRRDSDTARALRSAVIFLTRLDTAFHSPLTGEMREWVATRSLASGDNQAAMRYLRAACRDYIAVASDSDISRTGLAIAELYLAQNRLDSAFFFASQAAEKARSTNDIDRRISGLRVMGIVFGAAGASRRANDCFQQCVDLARSTPDSVRRIQSLVNSSALGFLADGKTDRALFLLEESVRLSGGYAEAPSRVLLNIAGVDVEAGDLPAARRYVSLASARPMTTDERAQWHKVTARILIESDSSAAAITHIEKALAIYDSVANAAKAMEMHAALATLYYDAGDNSLALAHSRSLRSLQLDENRDAMLARLYSFVADHDRRQTHREVDGEKRHWLILCFVIGAATAALLALAFFFLLRRRFSRRLQLASDDFNRRLHNTSEMTNLRKETAIRSAIAILEKHRGTDEVDEVLKLLNDSGDSRTERELATYIPYLDSDRYRRFLKDHPNLTPNESRIVIFVALHISTKQISELTGQSVSAINMAKLRLRRKLGITNSNISLTEYINSCHLDK